MSVEKFINNLATVLVLRNNPLAQLTIGLSVGIFDATKVGLETHGQLIDFPNSLFGLLTIEHIEHPSSNGFEFLSKQFDTGLNRPLAIALTATELDFEQLDGALNSRKPRGRRGHRLVFERV